jgi:hypothetical protein
MDLGARIWTIQLNSGHLATVILISKGIKKTFLINLTFHLKIKISINSSCLPKFNAFLRSVALEVND